jgi:signal transduction histidine kinase
MDLKMQTFVTLQEAEYRGLARHLHDDIGQLLAALCLQLHLSKDQGQLAPDPHLEQCMALTEQALERVRDMSLDLSPSLLHDVALPETLRDYLDRQSERTGLAVNLIISSSWTPLPREVEVACFRATQQALANVIRYASARQVQVELRQDAEAVYLTVCDDGVGFDPDSLEQGYISPQKLGLTAMRQRIELLGGRWSIESAPGQGTRICVSLPLDAS